MTIDSLTSYRDSEHGRLACWIRRPTNVPCLSAPLLGSDPEAQLPGFHQLRRMESHFPAVCLAAGSRESTVSQDSWKRTVHAVPWRRRPRPRLESTREFAIPWLRSGKKLLTGRSWVPGPRATLAEDPGGSARKPRRRQSSVRRGERARGLGGTWDL